MNKYVAAVFSDLVKQSEAWNTVPRARMAGLMGEYKQLAESLASRYGSLHFNFTGDGHMFLFDSADAAVQFALMLISQWRASFDTLIALANLEPIPLRLGCHFGDDTEIVGGARVGRGSIVAKRIEGEAEPDTVYVSEGILDLVDIPLYKFELVSPRSLKGDHLSSRVLYHIVSFDDAVQVPKRDREPTALDLFLKAVSFIGTPRENSDEEAKHYQEALRLRPDYPDAHYNYAILLDNRGRMEEAEKHYQEALRLRPDYPDAHNNYAVLLNNRGRMEEAEKHYQETLRLRPDHPDAHNNYAVLLKNRGRMEEAEKHYQEALRLRPDDPDYMRAVDNLTKRKEKRS